MAQRAALSMVGYALTHMHDDWVAEYKGELRSAREVGNGISVVFRVGPSGLSLRSGEIHLGTWPLSEIRLEPREFIPLSIEGEPWLFKPEDRVGFARDVVPVLSAGETSKVARSFRGDSGQGRSQRSRSAAALPSRWWLAFAAMLAVVMSFTLGRWTEYSGWFVIAIGLAAAAAVQPPGHPVPRSPRATGPKRTDRRPSKESRRAETTEDVVLARLFASALDVARVAREPQENSTDQSTPLIMPAAREHAPDSQHPVPDDSSLHATNDKASSIRPVGQAMDTPGVVAPPPSTSSSPSIINFNPELSDAPVPDDLTEIHGIGPKTATFLTTIGYTTFRHLAVIAEDDLERVMEFLGPGRERVFREDWMGQAAYLHQSHHGERITPRYPFS